MSSLANLRHDFGLSSKKATDFPLPPSLGPQLFPHSPLFPPLCPPTLFPLLRVPLPSFFLPFPLPFLHSLFASSDSSSSSPFSSSHSNCFASIESLIGGKEWQRTKSPEGKSYGVPSPAMPQNVHAKRNVSSRQRSGLPPSQRPLLRRFDEAKGSAEEKMGEKSAQRNGEQQRDREDKKREGARQQQKVCFGLTAEEKAQIRATEVNGEQAEGYRCFRCGKMFSYEYYRDKHLKFTRCVDNGNRRFPCALCSRSFEKRDRLRIHTLHVHERYRPHKCHMCLKAFSQSSSLNKHLRTHSGERPYQCPHCEKAFTASSILRTHIRQHSGEKPFKCAICGKCFASHAAHDSHTRRTHNG